MWLDYLGYLASAIVLISLLMSSTKKLRWINLVGSAIFAVYGYLVKAYPVGIMNSGIAFINIYYLYKMYSSNDYFRLLSIDKHSEYLRNFLKFYQKDIIKYFPNHEVDIDNADISFYILRNVVPAGLFVANKYKDDILRIDFDYVVPRYRDFKMGKYIYNNKKQVFLDKGFHSLITFTMNEKHKKYLHKMGFYHYPELDVNNNECYRIDLNTNK